MINRYALVLISAFVAAAINSAVQSVSAGALTAADGEAVHQTVIAKNSAFPVLGPVVFQTCKVEDCSDAAN